MGASEQEDLRRRAALAERDITAPDSGKRDAVTEAVRADLHARSQFGVKKYGMTLSENPSSHYAKLKHAYEEALDLAQYLRWAMMELEALHPSMMSKPHPMAGDR